MRSSTRWAVAAACGTVLLAAATAPRAAQAFRSWKAERRQARIAQAWQSVRAGQDFLGWNPASDENEADESVDPRLPEKDDPTLRSLVNAAEWGYPSPAFSAQKMRVAAEEAGKWAHLMPAQNGFFRAGRARSIDANAAPGASRQVVAAPSAPTGLPRWVSLGPTDVAGKEFNGDDYVANDSGRGQTVRVDPLDATGNTVYFAVSGGGVWRSTDFRAATPTWVPLTDTLGDLSIGAMDLFAGPDATHHTIWLGLGDFVDAPSGLVVVSRDSGTTWSAAIQLTGRYNNGVTFEPQPASPATRIRDIRVDPNNPEIVLVATDVGLFRSTNAATGAPPTFTLIDLENAGTILLKESAWSFAYLGAAAGGPSQWLLSGVYACAPTGASTAAYLNIPPQAGFGAAAGAACPGGNPGDIWKTSDGGATWVSARKAGLLGPVTGANLSAGQELGRMAIAAGTPVAGDPTQTVVYAQAGNANEAASRQVATFKTANSGASYVMLAKDTAAVTNPTLNADCNTMNVAHAQAFYNLAIAVDPTNNSNAIQGGDQCAVRTIDGGATWQAIADWLPLPNFVTVLGINQGNTSNAPLTMLPYVHADWHAITIANGTVYAGTDGGFFASSANPLDATSVFTSAVDATHMPVTWRSVNTGLVTHLHVSVASGDPVTGNHRFMFTGLQDNGTRFRDSGRSTKWNQVVGGDGVGAAISIRPDGSKQVFFQSVPRRRELCRPGKLFFVPSSFDPAIRVDCNSGLLHPNQGPDNLNTELFTWTSSLNPNLPNGDSEPFSMRYAAVRDEQGSLLTTSTQYAWKLTIDDSDVVNYELISNIFQAPRFSVNGAPPSVQPGDVVRTPRGMIVASQWTYTIPNSPAPSRLYGIPLASGWFYLGVENSFDTAFGVPTPWTWTSSRTVLGSTGAGGALQQMSSTSSIDFPHDPVHLGGPAPARPTDLLNTYIVSSVTPLDVANQLIRDDVGRIFKTVDNGQTWTSIAPVSSGMPNIPVNMVRFDPNDPTDRTIWAGTDIGVYRTSDGGVTWARYGSGLPMVRVTDMSFARNGSLVRIATYGRGMWEIHPNTEPRATGGTGDWDANGQIDFLDLAALASRLGTSASDPDPANLASPRYDYQVDFGATPDRTIDEADLSALLAKYGSNP
ncbi:MAG: hypothetical protein ACJ79H_00820 [Myxococcales bacterium]